MRLRSLSVLILFLSPLLSAQDKIPLVLGEDGRVEVEEVLKLASDMTGRRIVIDPALQGVHLRMVDDGAVTMNELRVLLSMHDIELVDAVVDGKPLLKAYLQRNILSREIGKVTRFFGAEDPLPAGNEVVTAVVELRVANVQQVFAQIRSVMARDRDRLGNIMYVSGSTRLIITDKADNVAYYKRIAAALDQPPSALSNRVLALKNARAGELAALLHNLLRARANVQNERGLGTTAQPQILSDDRTNQLVIIAQEEEFPMLLELVAQLDIEVTASLGVEHWIYTLAHANAHELSNELNSLFRGTVRVVASGRTNTLIFESAPGARAELEALVRSLDVAVEKAEE